MNLDHYFLLYFELSLEYSRWKYFVQGTLINNLLISFVKILSHHIMNCSWLPIIMKSSIYIAKQVYRIYQIMNCNLLWTQKNQTWLQSYWYWNWILDVHASTHPGQLCLLGRILRQLKWVSWRSTTSCWENPYVTTLS